MVRWAAATAVLAVLFFGISLSNEVTIVTSPPDLWGHVLLRKIYSVVAFGLIAFCLYRALDLAGRQYRSALVTCIVGLALYSGAIEVAQALLGSKEGLLYNALDVACGAIGGLLGALVGRRIARRV